MVAAVGVAQHGNSVGYEVFYNGESIGYVDSPTTVNVAVNQVSQQMATWYDNNNLDIEQDLIYKETIITGDEEILTLDDCVAAVYEQDIDLNVNGAALVIEGQEIAYTASVEEAEAIIDELVADYTETGDDEKIIDYEIQGSYAIVEKNIEYPSTQSTEEIKEAIVEGAEAVETYVVQDGDTNWDIAVNRGIDLRDMEDANPGTDLETLMPGQEINLNTVEPLLSVEVTKEVTYTETISYDTEYVEDSDMYEGEEEVVTKGENGEKEITSQITYVNDVETSENILSETTTKKPVTEVIKKGTKVKATTSSSSSSSTTTQSYGSISGSGMFIMPTSGYVSVIDKAGTHAGGCAVDICNSAGTPIYAAAGGTVTVAGWYYGYGYAVVIDHGNGYSTLYGHASSLGVSVGQTVSQGQYIAAMGSTGWSTANHLHLEVQYNGVRQYICNYFPVYVGANVYAGQ
jgi:murein DD-endopeptidase MepM/ murein hydrolase activator NlpD